MKTADLSKLLPSAQEMVEKLTLAEAEFSVLHKATICAFDLTNVRG